MDWLARRAHSDLDLGAHRNPLDLSTEDVNQERVSFVTAVVADGLAEQAARYTDTRPVAHLLIKP
jgi:hypothetical protein